RESASARRAAARRAGVARRGAADRSAERRSRSAEGRPAAAAPGADPHAAGAGVATRTATAMKCPKCGYLGFEEVERCRNCGYDFSLAPVDPLPELPIRRAAATPNPLDDLSLIDAAHTDESLAIPREPVAPSKTTAAPVKADWDLPDPSDEAS